MEALPSAIATATITNGVVSAITVGINSGIGYTSAKPPAVLISEPTYVREENTIDLYEGDFGIVTKVGIVQIYLLGQMVLQELVLELRIVFDLYIPKGSALRDENITKLML